MEQMDVDLECDAKSKANKTIINGVHLMAGGSTVPSVSISLHPLVIMNISEHWTRIRAQAGEARKVYGALIGKHKGRNVEIMNSFELKTDLAEGYVIINKDYYTTKEEQYKQVFSELDFIGWYTTGEMPTDIDLDIHRQIVEINECPIMLQLNPLSHNIDQLPVTLYESVIDIVRGEATMLFVALTYTLATEEAERIGIDHVARMSTNDTCDKSYVAEHLVTQGNAIKMLNTRIKIILKYINNVEVGKLSANQEILREIYALSYRLPVKQGAAFQEEFYTQYTDVGLINYLCFLTKGCKDMHNFINKYTTLKDRQGSVRFMRGLYCRP